MKVKGKFGIWGNFGNLGESGGTVGAGLGEPLGGVDP